MKNVLAAALAAATFAGSAGAVTVISVAGAPDPGAAGQTVMFDFNQATPQLTGDVQLVTGSMSGQYAAPAGNTSQYAVVPNAGLPRGVATLDVSGVGPIGSFSFYWGSIDDYNTVELLNGSNVVFALNGAELPRFDGNQTDANSNRRVFFTLGEGESITALRFVSNGVAFEFDDVAFAPPVPEPASWALMIVGFGLVGVAARKRKTVTVAS